MRNIIHYFVEGECERKLINAIKNKYIQSGKIKIANISQKIIHPAILRTLEKNAICVMIVDTDVLYNNKKCFQKILENKKNLEKNGVNYIFIYQDKNLEDEIVKSTSLKKISEMFGVKSIGEHKTIFIENKNLLQKLESIEFDVNKIWLYNDNKLPENKSKKIKL